jgi:hypothetical protein
MLFASPRNLSGQFPFGFHRKAQASQIDRWYCSAGEESLEKLTHQPQMLKLNARSIPACHADRRSTHRVGLPGHGMLNLCAECPCEALHWI